MKTQDQILNVINRLALQVLTDLEEHNVFNNDSDTIDALKSITKLCQLPETISDYAEEKSIRMSTLNVIKASRFLDWYFSDSIDTENLGDAMIEQLQTFGSANISVEQLFDGCGYIPQSICEHWDEDWENEQEYSPLDVEFINDLK